MSKILKGFVEIEALQSAAPNVVSPIGEMSTWAMTYTKDKNEFTDPAVAGYRLLATNYIDSVNGPEVPTSELITQVIDVVRRVMVYATTNPLPYNVDDYHNTLIADLFNTVSNLRFGPLRTNGYIQIFDWIEWDSATIPGTRVKIWLSDAAFASQYDLFDIVVIPPIPNIDDFFLIPNAVRNKIAAITPSQMMESIQAAKNRNPETYIRSEVFNYHSPILSDPQTPTTWNVLIYGYQGDNIDSIKDALVAYILAHTTHTEDEWKAIFPDIFKRTEFVFLPRWDLMSIPNLTVQAGMYRSILDPHEAVTYAKASVDFYPQEWIDQHLEILPYDYKAIMLEVITGSNNVEGIDSLLTVFPDYLPVSTSSPDFNRMTQATQEWILILEQLLIVAENLDSYTTVPEEVRVVIRSNKKYVSAYYNNVNYLVQQRIIAP
jgi:hypothetical protein